MILYHGSNMTFDKIELSKCLPNKDFGRGFYLTPSKHDATKRAADKCKKKVCCVTTEEEFNSIKEAAEKYNVTPQCIRKCCQGKYKTSGKLNDGTKLVWKYL